ncbi:MAG TPA: chain length-determining protein [Cellvibrio sp.]|uniref:XrtA system polysaccharide chain length determinant n=1 Tax=Cellvibrio sp. TaxID=1965322 RepID=UPI000EDF3DA7|nr:chain length-determining protein [Cellvibrio sp.]HCS64578.1 chain length-determining protein [Cellvibrio sp.]
MDKAYLKDLLAALRAELIRLRFWCVLLFLAVAYLFLAVGLVWPKSFTTKVVLFADVTNIIEPLLKGRAEITKIDRSEQASEVIYTRRIMLETAKQAGLMNKSLSVDEQDALVKRLREGVVVARERNANYVQISYTAGNPDRSFEVLNAVVNVFIEDITKRKRDESVGAYNFIDAQVQTYKRQLESAEEKLKEFKSKNTDGSEESVSARIGQLRQELETLKIAIEETQSRINSIQQQLNNEGQYLKAKGQVDEMNQRRQTLNAQLEQMLLSYQENYPDVVSLRAQIAELDTAITKLQSSGDVFGNSDKVQNPLYEELRKQAADAEVELRAQKRRMQSLLVLQEEEFARQQRIAASQAELSDLTRDYDVTKKVYDEMLQRKESARVSMTLDIEGQGVSYRIQEPASFPLKPSGLHFVHFAIVGPIMGLLAPIGLLLLFVMVDPHLRSARILQKQLPSDIEVIGVIPHYKSPIGERLLKKDVLLILSIAIVGMICYLAIAIYWQLVKG